MSQQPIPLSGHHLGQPLPTFKREDPFMHRLATPRAMPRIKERRRIVFDGPADDHSHVIHCLILCSITAAAF
jgi:hypothetical protein